MPSRHYDMLFYDDEADFIPQRTRHKMKFSWFIKRKAAKKAQEDRLRAAEDRIKSLEEELRGKPSIDLMSFYVAQWTGPSYTAPVTKRLDKIESVLRCKKCSGTGTNKCGCSGGLRK